MALIGLQIALIAVILRGRKFRYITAQKHKNGGVAGVASILLAPLLRWLSITAVPSAAALLPWRQSGWHARVGGTVAGRRPKRMEESAAAVHPQNHPFSPAREGSPMGTFGGERATSGRMQHAPPSMAPETRSCVGWRPGAGGRSQPSQTLHRHREMPPRREPMAKIWSLEAALYFRDAMWWYGSGCISLSLALSRSPSLTSILGRLWKGLNS